MFWKNLVGSSGGTEGAVTAVAQESEARPVVKPQVVRGREESGGRIVKLGEAETPVELTVRFRIDDQSQVGRAALILAATTSPESESEVRETLHRSGWKSVATEVGGLAGDLPQKITRAVVGAALNSGVVEKKGGEMHALMHAALEAMNGFISLSMLEASIGAKIAIVRNSTWLAVAVVGDTAYHAVAHHERCGLGIMHV